MTTQEAKLKNDIPRKEEHAKYSELYFPDLRSTVFSIFTGDRNVIERFVQIPNEVKLELDDDYKAVKEALNISSDVPIQVEFTDLGLAIKVIVKKENPEDGKTNVSIVEFVCLDWESDFDVLNVLSKALNELVLQCTRSIPKLVNNRANFRNINLIETNPIYDYMVLVYSLYKKLKIDETLPGCYIQTLMARRKITYNMLCHTLKYSTKLPELVKKWFSDPTIVKKQDYVKKITDNENNTKNEQEEIQDNQNHTVEHQDNKWALHLIDYTGQKFSQRLEFQYSPKRVYINDRYVNLDGDSSITG